MRFRQSAQFGYLPPDRSIVAVNAFADGSELDDNGNPIDSRVDLEGRTRTFSVFATDTRVVRQRLAPDRIGALQPHHCHQPRPHHAPAAPARWMATTVSAASPGARRRGRRVPDSAPSPA